MKAEYYREYYHLERKNWWFLARKEILKDQIKRLFKEKTKIEILNVGAALGASTLMLEEFGNVTSLEYDKSCCEFVKTELGLDFINGSIAELPFSNSIFDLVCAFDVVEHVQEDLVAISELHRVCKPNGYIFTTVPAYKFLWSEHDEINEHIRRYTMKKYRSLFKSQQSIIWFSSYFNSFLFPFIAFVRVIVSFFNPPKQKLNPKSDFGKVNEGIISKTLYRIFKSETFFLRQGLKFPFGVSLMVISKKNKDASI